MQGPTRRPLLDIVLGTRTFYLMYPHPSPTAPGRRRRLLAVAPALAVLALGACGSGESSEASGQSSPSPSSASTDAIDATDAVSDETQPSTTDAEASNDPAVTQVVSPTDPPATVATVVPTSPFPSLVDVLGVPEIAVTTAGSVGAHPVLSWEGVDGATEYQLSIVLDDGTPLWAWSGPETSVALGGGSDALPDDTPGARLDGPAHWDVVALSDGTVIAASAPTAAAP